MNRDTVAGDRYRWGTLAATTAAAMAANAVDSKADTCDRCNANIVGASATDDHRNVANTSAIGGCHLLLAARCVRQPTLSRPAGG